MDQVTVPYEKGLLEALGDPEEAAAYLNAALEDEDQRVFLLALRHVTEALGISQVARGSGLNRENLYRMLSATGNPQLTSLNSLLRSIGLRLAVEVEPSYTRASSAMAVAEDDAEYESDEEAPDA